MATDFKTIIRRQLGEPPPLTRAERDVIYEEIQSAINRMFVGRESTPEHFSTSLALQKAIGGIEAELNRASGPNATQRQLAKGLENNKVRTTAEAGVRPRRPEPSWIEKRLAPLKQIVKEFKTKYGFVATAATLISDFLKPILDFTLPIMIGSLVSGTAFLIAARFFPSSREKLQGAAMVSGVFLVCSTGLLGAQYLVPGATDQGVIADVIPGMSKVQKAMLVALDKIATNTKRTADGIERVGKSVETLKRETSDDSRKELINLGKHWTPQDFAQTFSMCDIRTLRLYKKAGMKIPRYDAVYLFLQTEDVNCLNEYSEEFSALGPDLCFSDYFFKPGFYSKIWLRGAVEKALSAAPDRRKFVEKVCGETRLRAEMPQLYR